ncbi:MAG: type II toxin-antitoxin system HicA family toxin [Candidatus Daviesbacteria bacterium]|nr:type II toxin-antitoxin system HicA family toxin [Candidatus Daviesbacteria bacterium]
MPRTYKPKEIASKYKKLGFVLDRQSGSHQIFYHPKTKKRAVIPYHLKEIPRGTLSAILRESGIYKDEFEKA